MRRKVQVRRSHAERREESEQRLLTAAAELISAEGFGAASLERVGKLAGYSRGLASQKFGSKEGLIRAVIHFLAARTQSATAQRRAQCRSATEEILAYADTVFTFIETDHLTRAFWTMMAAAIANRSPEQEMFLSEHQTAKRLLTEMIVRGQEAGHISTSLDAEAAATSIGCVLLGVGFECLLDPDLQIDRVKSVALRSIARALAC